MLVESQRQLLAEAYRSDAHMDVVLACDDGRVGVHGLVLAASSPVWRQLLEPRHSADSSATVLMPGCSLAEVDLLIKLFYCGTLNIRQKISLASIQDLSSWFFPQHTLQLQVNTKAGVSTVELALLKERPAVVKQEKTGDEALVPQRRPAESSCDSTAVVSDTLVKWTHKSLVDTGQVHEAYVKEEQQGASWESDFNLGGSPVSAEPAAAAAAAALPTDDTPAAAEDEAAGGRQESAVLMEQMMEEGSNKRCPQCSKEFLYPKDLKKHLLIHVKVLPFGCKICKKYVRTLSNVYKHLREKHSVEKGREKSFVIDEKGGSYVSTSEIVAEEIKSGRIDSSLLSYEENLSRGSVGANKKGALLYKCLVCGRKVARQSLRNHLNLHAMNKKFACDRCSKVFVSGSSLRTHQFKQHGQQRGARAQSACAHCPRAFSSTASRDHHQKTCLGANSAKRQKYFECMVCSKVFGYKCNLRVHQRVRHGINLGKLVKDYVCEHCHKVFKGKMRLHQHVAKEHPDAPGKLCDLCGKSFVTREKLQKHMAIHEMRVRNLQCSFCPKKFFRSDILEVHEKIHTNPVICTDCGKKFPEQRYLEVHRVKLHAEKKFACLSCAKSFATVGLLQSHQLVHVKRKEFHCDVCSKDFKAKSEWKRHILEHSDQLPLKCLLCGKGFLADSQLQKHIDNVHAKPTKLLMYCQHCEQELKSGTSSQKELPPEFNAIYNLKRHLSKHNCPLVGGQPAHDFDDGTQPSCDVCFRDRETYYKIRAHVKANNEKKVLPCRVCDRRFKTAQDLSVHSVVHTREKPYSCELCGEKFTQRGSLKTHQVRHKNGTVGMKMYGCTYCDRACKTYSALQAHKRSHQLNMLPASQAKDQVDLHAEADKQTLPQFILPDISLQSLDPDGGQFQVTTINLEGLEAAGLDYRSEGLITIDPSQLPGLTRSLPVGPSEIVGEGDSLTYRIQIIDDLAP